MFSLKIKSLCAYIFLLICSPAALSNEICDPVVQADPKISLVSKQLSVLAQQYNFSLIFPEEVDARATVEGTMKLSELIKLLTSGMNTILRHEKVEGCKALRLLEIEVITVGEEATLTSEQLISGFKVQEPVYIDNMEQYVIEVLMGERKAKVKQMTHEQRIEFKEVKKRLRVELKDEIKKNNKDKKGEKRLKRAEKRLKSADKPDE